MELGPSFLDFNQDFSRRALPALQRSSNRGFHRRVAEKFLDVRTVAMRVMTATGAAGSSKRASNAGGLQRRQRTQRKAGFRCELVEVVRRQAC